MVGSMAVNRFPTYACRLNLIQGDHLQRLNYIFPDGES